MAEMHTPSPSLSPSISTPCDHDHRKPATDTGADFNLMVLLAAILCAFLCALGLNTMLQCVFQCANRVLTKPLQWIASRRLTSGLRKKEVVALPTTTYSQQQHSNSSSGSPASNSSCAICLADFCDGDKIRFLPKCNHRFHVDCIDKWLVSHSSCPTCRHLLKSSDSLHSLHIVLA